MVQNIAPIFRQQLMNFKSKNPVEYDELYTEYIQGEVWYDDNFNVAFWINQNTVTFSNTPMGDNKHFITIDRILYQLKFQYNGRLYFKIDNYEYSLVKDIRDLMVNVLSKLFNLDYERDMSEFSIPIWKP